MDSSATDKAASAPAAPSSSSTASGASGGHVVATTAASTKLGSWSLDKSKVKKLGIKSSVLLALTKMAKGGVGKFHVFFGAAS